MTKIDRRRFVTALGAATALPAVSRTAAGAHQATAEQRGLRPDAATCFLSYHHRSDHPHSEVHFWSQPVCDIAHGEYLPPEIARGEIWYDHCDVAHEPAVRVDGNLASVLTSTLNGRPSPRTAFIALDSLSPLGQQEWADLLPAFRSCYDRIIGHFHLERRGLRQWKACLDGTFPQENGKSYFQTFFRDAAAQCDAVIVTSPALVENDIRCCPRASTEELVGKLMHHLGCALLTPAVRERIVGAGAHGTMRKPRFFALASLVLETMDDYYLNADLLIGRQGQLVRGSFGNAVPGERFLLVATAVEDAHSDLVDEIRRVADGSFFTTTKPAYEVERRGHAIMNHLHMITLWPFALDEDKLRSA